MCIDFMTKNINTEMGILKWLMGIYGNFKNNFLGKKVEFFDLFFIVVYLAICLNTFNMTFSPTIFALVLANLMFLF